MSQVRRSNPVWDRQVKLAAGTPFFARVELSSALIGSIMLRWHDATSAFTVKLYTSNADLATTPADAGSVDLLDWVEETAIVPTGGTGAAAGSSMTHLGNNGAKSVLLQFDVTANSIISILVHGKE